MAFSNQNLIRCIGLEQPESTPVEKKALVRNNETVFCEAGSLTPRGWGGSLECSFDFELCLLCL